MTAKKKRKKLIINCSPYYVTPESPIGGQIVPPLSAPFPRIVFDACPGQYADEPGGSFSKTALQASSNSNKISANQNKDYWIEELNGGNGDSMAMTNLNRFFQQLFGSNIGQCEQIRSFSFVSRVLGSTQDRTVSWNCIQANNSNLFVQIDSATFPEGSRGSFVQLLDFAEEELNCENVFACFPGDHPQKEAIMKTFMFLSFVPVRADHPGLPKEAAIKFTFMGYAIE